jgi:GDPmannose 4,6-dehydratase
VAKAAAFWEVANYREAYDLYACSGILFNHESSLRPERFVTRKVVAAACRIAAGSKEKLHLGDLDIARDWGWAPEYVEAMWRMLQQDAPDDYVVATGETHSLQDFVETAFSHVDLDWRSHVITDASLARPNELRMSRANPAKVHERLGWKARHGMREVVRLMMEEEARMGQAQHRPITAD